LTGGSNTFNITNGTAKIDLAAGADVNIDDDVTIAAELHVEAATHVNQDLTTDAGPTFDHLHTATITAPAASLVLKPTADATTAIQLADQDGNAVLTVDTTNDRVGIGGTPSYKFNVIDTSLGTYGIYCLKTSDDPAGAQVGISVSMTNNATIAHAHSIHGLLFNNIIGTDSYNRTGIHYGIQGSVSHSGTGTLSYAEGGFLGVKVNADSPGKIGTAYGLVIGNGIYTGKTGTITNNYDIFLNSPSTGSGSITNDYGLWIGNRAGSTLNYAIYTGTGLVRFGGAFGCNAATPQTSYVVGEAAPAGGTGATAGAYDTAAHRDSLITLVNNIRTALINNGIAIAA
jgi:hypothetical protein